MFERQPNLANADVQLRPLTAMDWTALFAAASDPQIWAGHPAHDRWREPVFRRFFDQALASGGALVALDPASGAIIGAPVRHLIYAIDTIGFTLGPLARIL
jgi:hypothetical protein